MTTRTAPRNITRTIPLKVMASLTLVGALALTGCSSPAEEDYDAIAVGQDDVVGSVELLSFLLVATDDGEPGRLLGTLNNESDEPIEVTISDDDDDVTVTVPAKGQFPLDTNETVLDTVGDAPGARTSITATTMEGTTELSIPVLDGTLERYEPYLPN